VIGRTAEAQAKKSPTRSTTPATVDEIIEKIGRRSSKESEVARQILHWSKHYFTTKCSSAQFRLDLIDNPETFHPLAITNDGRLWIYNKNIRGTRPFDVIEKWTEFRRRLDDIPGVSFPDNETYSSAKLLSLADDVALKHFLNVIVWVIEQVRGASQNSQIASAAL
jgi:hypothetical protein